MTLPQKSMLLFAGLGNPGKEYERNRHNAGFMALNRIEKQYAFSPWSKKFHTEISEGFLAGSHLILCKPQTFMNFSGQAIGEIIRFYKLAPSQLTVFHDEMNLPEGKLHIKKGGSHGGHKGILSVNQHVLNEYRRLRIGIGHPADKGQVPDHVLGDFTPKEQEWLEVVLEVIAKGIPFLISESESRFLEAARATKTKAEAKNPPD